MQDEEVLAEFRASKALLEGHFLLSSGRHSAHYLQCARIGRREIDNSQGVEGGTMGFHRPKQRKQEAR